MPTQKQLRANRLNAQKCTGPRSVEGKARSSWNALKSGIHADSEVLPWEDPAERAALRDEYHAHHQPCTPEERAMVDNLVHGEFLGRRFRRSEVQILVSKLPAGADLTDRTLIGKAYSDAGAELARLQRRMDAANRAFHRDLDELRLLQAERPLFPPPVPFEEVDPLPETPSPGPIAAAPVPEPEPAPQSEPESQPGGPPPQPAAIVAEGLKNILGRLKENLNPTQARIFHVSRAASLYRHQHGIFRPEEQFMVGSISRVQPQQTESRTPQSVSFRQDTEKAA